MALPVNNHPVDPAKNKQAESCKYHHIANITGRISPVHHIRREIETGKKSIPPFSIGKQNLDFIGTVYKTAEGEDRQDQRKAVNKRKCLFIPGLQPEPKMKPETAVNPGNNQRQALQQCLERGRNPKAEQDRMINGGIARPSVI